MYINLNGTLLPASQNNIHHSNRGLRYGDGIFEAMVMHDGKVKLLPYHCRRMAKGAKVLELNIPHALLEDQIEVSLEIIRKANNLSNARIRIMLFRNSGGYYAPLTHDAGFIIESEPMENRGYEFNILGLRLGVYEKVLKPINIFSNIKTCNALGYVMAGIYKSSAGLDDCIILNEKENICESISNNIFWIKDKIIYTPAAASGCIMGVMRGYILEQLRKKNFKCEEGEFGMQAILDSDEVFISGATKGIHWVEELIFEDRSYQKSKTVTKEIYDVLFYCNDQQIWDLH